MSRSEAAALVLAAGSLKDRAALYLLDMGEAISIADLANELIVWSGFAAGDDIKIVTTGLRPGERLEEQLVATGETLDQTEIDGVHAVRVLPQSFHVDLARLGRAVASNDKDLARIVLTGAAEIPVLATAEISILATAENSR